MEGLWKKKYQTLQDRYKDVIQSLKNDGFHGGHNFYQSRQKNISK